MTAQAVTIGERHYRVRSPSWAHWTLALERAGGDSARLLEECLLTCLEGATVAELRQLPALEGDRLMAAALQAIDSDRAALRLELVEGPGDWRVHGNGVDLLLRPWTFGQRNQALRQALSLQDGQVGVDLTTYERLMIQHCTFTADGNPVDAQAIAAWPVPLGELVIETLDRLNGVADSQVAVLAACIREGREHPDLTLIHLCRQFCWQPEQVERLDAGTAQRLLTALKALEQGLPSAAPAAVGAAGEGVRRILVEDD